MESGSNFSYGFPSFYSENLGDSNISAINTLLPPQLRATPRGLFLDVPQANTPQRQQVSPSPYPKRPLSEFQPQSQQHDAQDRLLVRSIRQRLQNEFHQVSPTQQQQEEQQINASPSLQQSPEMTHIHQLQPQPKKQHYPPNMSKSQFQKQCFSPIPSQIQHEQIFTPPLSLAPKNYSPLGSASQQHQPQYHSSPLFQSAHTSVQNFPSSLTNKNPYTSKILHDVERKLLYDDYTKNETISPFSSLPLSQSVTNIEFVSQKAKQILINAATAISELKIDVACDLLTKLSTRFADPFGAVQLRVVHYMVSALRSMVDTPQIEFLNPLNKEYLEATHLLYERSICFKLGFMCANLTIVKAAMETTFYNNDNVIKIHLLDFDIGKGDHYKHILTVIDSLRRGRNSLLKITTIWDCTLEDNERMNQVSEDTKWHAQKLGIKLKFQPLSLSMNELNRNALGVENDEFLAVNFSFYLQKMFDDSVSLENPRNTLLRSVKAMSPNIVTLVEEELNTNTTPFISRLDQAYDHYAILLETIEPFTPSDQRVKIEGLLSHKMVNSVICEGTQRINRFEVYSEWKARMNMVGFKMMQMNSYTAQALRVNLSIMTQNKSGFMIKEKNGVIELCKDEKTLMVGSAWS